MIHALVATVLERKRSCQRLLANLANQSLRPDAVELVLDGYGAAPAPVASSPIAVREWRTEKPLGPGGRWRVARELPPDTILVVVDDDVDIAEARRLVELLVRSVEAGGAAAASGTTASGRHVPWGVAGAGELLCGNAGTMALWARDLAGLELLREGVRAWHGFDPLGDLGDDEALVAAHLWSCGVTIRHVPAPGLALTHGTQHDGVQHRRRIARDGRWDAQRKAIAKVTGWPWPFLDGAHEARR